MYSDNNNDGEEEDRIENLKTKKQKQWVTREKEEKGKIREKTEKQRKKIKERESQFRRHAPIGYFPLSLLKNLALYQKTKKGVPLGTNHSSPLSSK